MPMVLLEPEPPLAVYAGPPVRMDVDAGRPGIDPLFGVAPTIEMLPVLALTKLLFNEKNRVPVSSSPGLVKVIGEPPDGVRVTVKFAPSVGAELLPVPLP
jgi:hypothetical protein